MKEISEAITEAIDTVRSKPTYAKQARNAQIRREYADLHKRMTKGAAVIMLQKKYELCSRQIRRIIDKTDGGKHNK